MTAIARLIRLGGEYERAVQARDMERAVTLDHQIDALGKTLIEDVAWWNLVIRGRNIIRRARGFDEVYY